MQAGLAMDRKYRTVKVIGSGAYGKAILVESRASKVKYVLKQVDMRKMKTKEKEEARKECELLRQMSHPNIISFIESFESGSKLNIVMDYADGGDLANALEKRRGRLFAEEQIVDYFVQICLAMKHVHDRKILHRDLKAQNIFLTSKGMVKLGDFGIAKVLRNTRDLARTQIGTPYYLSPEICNGKPYNNKSDVWSLGVVLYELATLKHPFEGRNIQNLVVAITRGKYSPISSKYTRPLKNLLDSLLAQSQTMRPSVNKILKQPIMQKRISTFLGDTLLAEEFSHTVLHGQRGGSASNRPAPRRQWSAAPKAVPKAAPASVPASAPAARNPKPSSDPTAQSRGICPGCNKNVMTDQDRTKDDQGRYWHVECVKAARGADRPRSGKEPPASVVSRTPSEDTGADDASSYAAEARQRHADFIARRKARLANKKRYNNEQYGSNRPAWQDAVPIPEPNFSAPAPAPAPAPADESKEAERLQLAREYNERQRQAQANRAKNPDRYDATPSSVSRESSSSKSVRDGTTPKADEVDDEVTKRAAAVAEFNERQRQAREFRARAEQDRNPPPVSEEAHPSSAVEIAAPPAAPVRRVTRPSQPKAAPKTTAASAPSSGARKDINLGQTTVIKKGKSDQENLPSVSEGDRAADVRKSAAARRAELRKMIEKQRADLKKQGQMAHKDVLPPIGESPAKPVASVDEYSGQEDLGSTIAKFLNAQISGLPTDISEEMEAPAPVVSDESEVAADEEQEREDKEDKDYQQYLLQLSMVARGDQLENNEDADDGNWLNGSEIAQPDDEDDDDSDFGEDADTAHGEESIFAKMERLKAELEEDVGCDLFIKVYKMLRDAFEGNPEQNQVPQDVATSVLEALGEDKEDLYDNLVGLVKSEYGIFE